MFVTNIETRENSNSVLTETYDWQMRWLKAVPLSHLVTMPQLHLNGKWWGEKENWDQWASAWMMSSIQVKTASFDPCTQPEEDVPHERSLLPHLSLAADRWPITRPWMKDRTPIWSGLIAIGRHWPFSEQHAGFSCGAGLCGHGWIKPSCVWCYCRRNTNRKKTRVSTWWHETRG